MKIYISLLLILSFQLYAQVQTQALSRGDLNAYQTFNGTITFNEKSHLASENEGKIIQLHFDEGDFVKKGTLLLSIDSQILDANIAATEASIKEAQFTVEKARRDFKRYEVLLKQSSVSQQQYDEFYFLKMQYEQKLIALQASLKAQKIAKEKKQIHAPFSGYIVSRSVHIGEWLKVGSEVATLINPKKVDIVVYLSPEYIQTISKHHNVTVTINNKSYPADMIAPLLLGDEKTRTFPVKFRLRPSTDIFFEGMAASIKLPRFSSSNTLITSRDALITRFGKNIVFVKKENKAVMIPVNIIAYHGDEVAISSKDLHEGDAIIIKGHERLRPNQELQP